MRETRWRCLEGGVGREGEGKKRRGGEGRGMGERQRKQR